MAGRVELAVAEAAAQPVSRPERVTSVLTAAYETIAGQPVSSDRARGLNCAAREWLLQRAAGHFRPDVTWFEVSCDACGQLFDLTLRLADGVRRSPDRSASSVEVETSVGAREFQVPNGHHEEAFARRHSDLADDPRRAFAALCGTSDQCIEESACFNEHDLQLIDEALEAASPDIADEVVTDCPSCSRPTSARIDPFLFAFPSESDVLHDTHVIAMAYGWPLDQILILSSRHRAYLVQSIAQHRRTNAGAPRRLT